MRPSCPDRLRRPLALAALLLGAGLIGGEGLVMGLAIWTPKVSPQYRAVFMTRSQTCWLSPTEQAEAAADTMLRRHVGLMQIDQLDHREACSLLPDGWSSGEHRTADGQIYSRAAVARILLPVQPDQSVATLLLEGYAPPLLAAGIETITVQPKVDGVAAPSVTLRRGMAMPIHLALPPSDTPRLVAITLTMPQPGWVHPFSMSDDPQYAGVVLRSITRN